MHSDETSTKGSRVQVSVVYAVAIGEPHFGNIGPFAIGLAQWAGGFGGKLVDHAASLWLLIMTTS